MPAGNTVVGIDFGTSTTLVAMREGEGPVRVVPIGHTNPWMPTLLALGDDGLLVGEDAAGRPEASVLRSVKTDLAFGQTTVVRRAPSGVEQEIAVRDAIWAVFAEVRQRAGRAGLDLSRRPVRLSCPANWSTSPRLELIDIARAADLDASLHRLLDEPISAGVSWTMGRYLAGSALPVGRVLVFDFGGGTLDLAVLEISKSSPPDITVLASAAVTEAGDRLDQIIAGELREEVGLDTARSAVGNLSEAELDRLFRLAATRLKEGLSATEEQTTNLGGSTGLALRYSRAQLESAFQPMLEKAMRLVWSALRAAELRRRSAGSTADLRALGEADLAADVDWVLLAGGMSRVPAVAARLRRAFPDAVVSADEGLGAPEESVASGLTYEGAVSGLNLDRPAFNMVVQLVDRGRVLEQVVVYPAFSPLYSPAEVARGEGQLGYGASVANPTGRLLDAELRCVGVDGAVLPLYVDGTQRDALKVRVEGKKHVSFKLYVDGRVAFNGRENRLLRVERWPVIRGAGDARIEFVTQQSRHTNYQVGHWWGERL